MAEDGGLYKRALTSLTDLDDVLDEILAWLPVKSLMRFRCVCKSWRALISQSYFVTKHFNYASKRFTENTSRLLISTSPLKSLDCEASMLSLDCEALKDLNDDGDAHLAIRKLEFPVMFPNSSRRNIVGSCNGLICVEIDLKDMVLWNPCTGQSNLLPKRPGQVSSQLCGVGYDLTTKFSGFGYDSTNDDYKVVRGYNYRVTGSEETVVQVFSLKSGSWRTHEGLSYFGLVGPGCLLNGALHWPETIFDHFDPTDSRIISFDLAQEKFREMLPLPSQAGFECYFVCGDCLGVYEYSDPNNEFVRFRIWMMKEYGVKESWTEVASLDILHKDAEFSLLMPLCILENGEGLIANRYDFQSLVLYSFKEQTFRNVFKTHNKWNFDAVIYRETLVSPATSGIADI
ncbi:putative F-box domain-containing protein [Rosa chinensis]|uniref:Putative F-box domain-containing protein n=1 Tax=Rosa chinensis TaxID=74649 RepID=A0A2P6SF74_ROSCH|nr:F-box/kelch-repeat protein At3g23880 [Rosa chinensis]PRQ57332.1 putative F-box domain-containing protein [Rosa chinensis]